MALKKEKIKYVLKQEDLDADPKLAEEHKAGDEIVVGEELVFVLKCACGDEGGEVRFPLDHGRKSDAELEREMLATYSHTCHTCCCEGRDNPSLGYYGKACKINLHA